MSKLPCLVNLPKQEGAIVVKAATLARLGASNQHLAKSHSLTNKHLIAPSSSSALVAHVPPMSCWKACDLPCFARG